MAQRGRPKSGDPRDNIVPVRFTVSEHEEVARAADAAGVSLSAYLRARGLAAAKRSLRREQS
ncbi:plasmid mobilization protein [Rhodococcoides yunnanense]|uniref:plasmid mobilization protein n=1 Tax=Rhodococcoides yunnanense TaxID=278209 RepID=UPI00352FF87A